MKRAKRVEEMIKAKLVEIAATEQLLHRQRIELEDLEKLRHEPTDRTAVHAKRPEAGKGLRSRP